MKDLIIRNERPDDYPQVEHITREAFWNHYGPGCNEHFLIHQMRTDPTFIKELDLVAQLEDKVVGNIVYTLGKLFCDDGSVHDVISFGPLSVLPDFQGQGIGAKLVEHSLNMAKELGYKRVLIYGDPDFYHQFGFVPAQTYNIATAENEFSGGLLALELVEGALSHHSGRHFPSQVYDVNMDDFEAFDLKHPKKEKLEGTPSQLRLLDLMKGNKPRQK